MDDKAGKVGDKTGGKHARQREKQGQRSRDKTLSGARGNTPCSTSLVHGWPRWGLC